MAPVARAAGRETTAATREEAGQEEEEEPEEAASISMRRRAMRAPPRLIPCDPVKQDCPAGNVCMGGCSKDTSMSVVAC